MADNNSERGKVLEFKPRKKRRLKTLNYVDPAKKELLEMRKRQRQMAKTRKTVIKNAGYFLLICIAFYIIKFFI